MSPGKCRKFGGKSHRWDALLPRAGLHVAEAATIINRTKHASNNRGEMRAKTDGKWVRIAPQHDLERVSRRDREVLRAPPAEQRGDSSDRGRGDCSPQVVQ